MKKDKNIELMQDLIINGKNSEAKSLVNEGMDIHYSNDYFLYIATFAKNVELQKYFIDLGLDPEVTKGRLALADPKGLEYLRTLKREKQIREFAIELNDSLPNNNNHKQPRTKI
jgi:hypothetical protein